MRIFLIPGFGETPAIFSKIEEHFLYEKVFIDHLEGLGTTLRNDYTVLNYAQDLVKQYNISKNDVIIGHSMGGWIALYIKHLVACPIVQLASWTAINKVKSQVKSKQLSYWAIKNGLHGNPLVYWTLKRMRRKRPYSMAIFLNVYDNLVNGNRNNILNQFKVIFNQVNPTTVIPDLRQHAKKDKVVACPEEDFMLVPGDHFTLYTHPEAVYPSIVSLLKNHATTLNRSNVP